MLSHDILNTNYGTKGVVPTHWAIVATLMGSMADHQLDFKALLMSIDTEPNKARGKPITRLSNEERI